MTASGSLLEGAFNCRDLGGLPTTDGRWLRPGRLLRSDTLQALTPADVRRLTELGLRTVVDLRLEQEVIEEGCGLLAQQPQVRFVNLPFGMASTEDVAPEQVLDRLYERCLQSPFLSRSIGTIAAHIDQPLLFHCAAGKDRTGIVAAVILGLVDVERDAIIADYLRSADAVPRMLARFRIWPRYRDHVDAMPAAVYACEAATIERFLDRIERDFGGFSGWAISAGIEAQAIMRLNAALVGDDRSRELSMVGPAGH